MAQENSFSMFSRQRTDESRLADVLLTSSFDLLFEIDLTQDRFRKLYGTGGNLYLPLTEGTFTPVQDFVAEHYIHPEEQYLYREFMEPSSLNKRAAEASPVGVLIGGFRYLTEANDYAWLRFVLITGEYNGVPDGKIYLFIFNMHTQKVKDIMYSSSPESTLEREPLTSLWDGHSFFQLAEAHRKPGKQYCCMSLDICQFTLYNAIHGPERGNYLLSAFAEALDFAAAERDAVAACFGQDDFALFAEYDPEWIRSLYDQLRSTLVTYSNSVGFPPAIGVYRLPDDEPISLAMYDNALTAMGEAKNHPSQRVVEYNSSAYQSRLDEYQKLLELQQAIAGDRVEFFLQPQCRISTGKIIGAEALVRLRNPDGSLIPPYRFIPILEKNGFIADLDKRVWEMVCAWIRSLLSQGIHPVPVSINVSQMDIMTMDVVSYLYMLTQKYNIPARFLKVEITESFYAENSESVQQFVKALSEKGFMTMMDDFGSGYSSLNMLETLTVDVLKLDMAFMRESNVNTRKGVTIVESIINMAKMMGLPIIIEGVENEQQIQFLQNLGCRYAQGYYFHRPMPKEEFEALLRSPAQVDHRGIIGKANEQFHVREFLDENTFTDTVLNSILGAVAYYSYDGKDLTINRFNQQFYHTIGDVKMESRQQGIQNYMVKEDRPALFKALENAYNNPATGGICEVRFYKSDGGVFWFHMHLFYLKNEDTRRIYYGKIEDVTELRMQSVQFFEVLRSQSRMCMRINLNQNTIEYILPDQTLSQTNLGSLELEVSMAQTSRSRIPDDAERQRFMEFFNADRLRDVYQKGIYHEKLELSFCLSGKPEPITFSNYYIRYSLEQDLYVYVFII